MGNDPAQCLLPLCSHTHHQNYAEVLNGVIAYLDETAVYQLALQQVTAGVEAKRSEIETAVTNAVRQQVEEEANPLVI